MIDLVNKQGISIEQRKWSLQRALYSQPFFALLDMVQITAAQNFYQYGAKTGVDKDFWLTEIKGNFGEQFNVASTLFIMNLFLANSGLSLNRYIAGEDLPTQFQCSNTRETVAMVPAGLDFCDLQREIMPTLIPKNDRIIARVKNVAAKAHTADVQVVCSGYYAIDEKPYISKQQQEGIDDSLAEDSRFELHKFTVDYDGQRDHILNNDRFSRLILGFGIVMKNYTGTSYSQGTVQITDTYRSLKLNNDPINIAFFAPKQPLVKDTPIYWLPIEHYWGALHSMKFSIVNDLQNSDTGYDFCILTRTV